MVAPDEELVPIVSELELQPGLLVELRPCWACMAGHRTLIVWTRLGFRGEFVVSHGQTFSAEGHVRCRAYPPDCNGLTEGYFVRPIQEGRLFRVETHLRGEVNPYTLEPLRLED